MSNIRVVCFQSLLLAVLALPACGDSRDDSEGKKAAPDETPTAVRDAGSSANSATSDPIGDLINAVLGDGGLAGIAGLFGDGGLAGLGGLFGDGGLAGLGGLFGDGGFPNFGNGGFDASIFCAQAPGLCPDGGNVPLDAGMKVDDAGALSNDAASIDAASVDAASIDAASIDAASIDAGSIDAGT